ncbi:MAG: high-potential iron-sulfur protein [Rubrivivax sp.]|nr:high-potential iron-sulfur protein [Rubrivivax sp.]
MPQETTTPAPSNAATLVSPGDPQAVTLGYVPVASQADATKYKTYAAGQSCANCALYAGKAGEAAGACPLFPGRLVSAQGWCSAWAKKA